MSWYNYSLEVLNSTMRLDSSYVFCTSKNDYIHELICVR